MATRIKKMGSLLGAMMTLAVCAAGCGGYGDKWSGPVGLDDLCEVVVNDICTSLIQCYDWNYRDMDHCLADQECLGMEVLVAEVEAGYVNYDAEATGRCHRRLAEDPCGFSGFLFVPTVFGILDACGDVLTGNQSPGDPCITPLDCLPEAYCLPHDVCPATCVAWAKAGEICDDWEGPRCDTRQGLRCKDGICTLLSGLGEPCDSIMDCKDDFRCSRTANICQAYSAEGEPCNEFDGPECADDLWCDSRFDTGTCRGPASDGESCLSDFNCEEPLSCLPTYTDPQDPGTCGPGAGAGEPCDSLDDCAEGFECSDGLCGPLPGLGETCNYDQCSADLVCEQDVCVHARYPGDTCGEVDSACILSNCVDGKCKSRAALGEPCVEDYDCSSRTCMEGECVDDTDCMP